MANLKLKKLQRQKLEICNLYECDKNQNLFAKTDMLKISNIIVFQREFAHNTPRTRSHKPLIDQESMHIVLLHCSFY